MLMISLSFPPRLFLSFRLNFSTTYVRLTAPMLWYARCGRQKVSHLIRHDKNVNDIPDARYFDSRRLVDTLDKTSPSRAYANLRMVRNATLLFTRDYAE